MRAVLAAAVVLLGLLAPAAPAAAEGRAVRDPHDTRLPPNADIRRFGFSASAERVVGSFRLTRHRDGATNARLTFQMLEDPGFIYYATARWNGRRYKAVLVAAPNTVSTYRVRCPGMRVTTRTGPRGRIKIVVPGSCLATPSAWRNVSGYTFREDVVDDVRLGQDVAVG